MVSNDVRAIRNLLYACGHLFFAAYMLSAGTMASKASMVYEYQTRSATPAVSAGHFYRKCIYNKHTHIAWRQTRMGGVIYTY